MDECGNSDREPYRERSDADAGFYVGEERDKHTAERCAGADKAGKIRVVGHFTFSMRTHEPVKISFAPVMVFACFANKNETSPDVNPVLIYAI